MKIGELFDLPENVTRQEGIRGKIKNTDETRVVGLYEVVKVKLEKKLESPNKDGERIELVEEFKGKLIVTYGNKRRKNN